LPALRQAIYLRHERGASGLLVRRVARSEDSGSGQRLFLSAMSSTTHRSPRGKSGRLVTRRQQQYGVAIGPGKDLIGRFAPRQPEMIQMFQRSGDDGRLTWNW